MPEYRQDFLTGRMVIVAEERASRPYQFDIEGGSEPICPFCPGNESITPDEILAFRPDGAAPNSSDWTVRTVPNLYPAVVRTAEGDAINTDWQVVRPGFGTHEVIVDTPRHVLSLSEMTESEVDAMFRMYAIRIRSLRSEGRFSSVMIFKNVGQAAGASLPHSHSQLIALPFVPESLRAEQVRAQVYMERTGSPCPWCTMLQGELHAAARIIEETVGFVALCPFASRFPAEVAVYPKGHEPYFEEQSDGDLSECARLVRRTVQRLEKSTPWIKGRLAYNIILHTGPFDREGVLSYHFRFSILPSLSRAAGFEWGTGLHINPISPENAAARLRLAPH